MLEHEVQVFVEQEQLLKVFQLLALTPKLAQLIAQSLASLPKDKLIS
jgi:hypothetical protein